MSEGKAFVLLSGGVDSSTCLYAAAFRDGFGPSRTIGVSVQYGQRHSRAEVGKASEICDELGCDHEVIHIPMPSGGLTDPQGEIPDISYDEIQGVSPTYVPFRNGLLIATLAGIAHAKGGRGSAVYHGAHAEDARGGAYPDCTLEFIGAMAAAVEKGTYGEVQLKAPFIQSLKHEIILLGTKLGVPYEKTWSCYRGGEIHCGTCPTCRARKQAFFEASVPDPTQYAA